MKERALQSHYTLGRPSIGLHLRAKLGWNTQFRNARRAICARRSLVVTIVAGLALITSLPNLIYFLLPIYGGFGFATDYRHCVVFVNYDAARAGIRIGDCLDYATTPVNERYAIPNFRLAPYKARATFHVDRNGVQRQLTVTADQPSTAWGKHGVLLSYVVKKLGSLVLILAGVTLVLVRPRRLTAAFFLTSVGSTHANPLFWSFLPTPWFFSVQAIYELLNAGGTVAFLVLAVRLLGDPGTGWRATIDRSAPVFFAAAVALALAGNIAGELLLHPFGAFLLDAQDIFAILLGLLAVGVLVDTVCRPRAGASRGLRCAAVGLAVAGTGNVLSLLVNSSWSTWSLPPIAYEFGWVVNVAISCVTAYIIVRYRVVDVRAVAIRSAMYGILAITIVAAFATLNIAFAKQWAQTAFVIPLEIIVAVFLGYALSGLADVAAALSMADVDATAAIVQGCRAEQREIFAKALGRAERTRRRSIVADVRARAAFAAWVAGEELEFARAVDALELLAGSSRSAGLRAFLRAARGGQCLTSPVTSVNSEWLARAYLIEAANAEHARTGVDPLSNARQAAELSDTPYLRVLACVAAGESDAEMRADYYESAITIATAIGSPFLVGSLRELALGNIPDGFVAFVRRFRASCDPELEVHFLTATVRRFGADVALRDSEKALLFALAYRPGPIASAALIDALWPDSDGDAAQNSLRVCLHRLRKALGTPDLVRKVGRAYDIVANAFVDVHVLPESVDTRGLETSLATSVRIALENAHQRLRATRPHRAIAGPWFEAYALELQRREREYGLCLAADALVRHDIHAAARLATDVLREYPDDEQAHTIVGRSAAMQRAAAALNA